MQTTSWQDSYQITGPGYKMMDFLNPLTAARPGFPNFFFTQDQRMSPSSFKTLVWWINCIHHYSTVYYWNIFEWRPHAISLFLIAFSVPQNKKKCSELISSLHKGKAVWENLNSFLARIFQPAFLVLMPIAKAKIIHYLSLILHNSLQSTLNVPGVQ